MATHEGLHCYGSTSVESSVCAYNEIPKNKFIFVKQNNQKPTKGSTILVNPRFKDNTKVFINPNFSTNVKDIVVSRPSIYLNPKLINSMSSFSNPNSEIRNVLPANRNPLKVLPTDTSRRVLVSTKNKLIKVPEIKSNNIPHTLTNFPKVIDAAERQFKVLAKDNRVIVSTKNKLIKVSESKTVLRTSSNLPKSIYSSSNLYKKHNISPNKHLKTLEYSKLLRTKVMPAQNKKSFINTRFKYIKTAASKKLSNSVMRSPHKIINNIVNANKTVNQSVQYVGRTSPNFRKRFIYVNKYNSSSFLANNVILKNTSKRSFINVNGILYQNSPSALKKTNISVHSHKDSRSSSSLLNSQLRKNSLKTSPKFKKISGHMIMGHEGRYKLVRTQIASASKLKKCNLPCPIFKKHGKCSGQKNGTCIKVHNSDQIILCSKFLRGACIKKNCPLSHKVSAEKMPTCKFFLEGSCFRDDCQYLHVKISPKADICRDFLDGFCKAGRECEKRHQLLCPEFEKFQRCPRRMCEYPHISKVTLGKVVSKKLTKVSKKKKVKIVEENVIEPSEKPNIRYYNEAENKEEIEETLISQRPKLGLLPSFIAFSEDPSVS